MKKSLLVVIVFLVAVVGWVVYTFYTAYQPKAPILQGEIDAQSYSISSKLPGRIGEIFVKKGDKVKKGEKIFTILSPEVEAKLAQAEAAKEAAYAKKMQADNGARAEEIKAAYDQWQKAKSAESLMKSTYERVERLYRDGVVSEQKRDEVATKYKASKYTASAAKELYVMAKKGARKEVKKAADAQVKVYEAKIEEVDSYVKESIAYTFHDAEVSDILIHSGELAPTGFPVVTTLDMSDAWARFAVREDYMPAFKMGKIFEVRIPALGDKKYKFRVAYISPMGEYATWKATQSGKGFDMKSFEVQLRPLTPIDDLRVGMSVLLEL